ncbi:MAG: T9SS type A sorting domain-containing protein, partial [Saprospiraceae bacterium]
NIRCNGGFDGSLTALPVGGDAPFKFAWSNGNTEATISGLSIGPPHMGTYTVTATNAQGCSGTASATISQPLPLAFASAPIVQDATNSLDNGSIQVNITGGTTPYQYQWLYLNNSPVSGQNSSLIDSIYADKYKVRVTDFNGCTFVSSPIEVLNIIDSMIGTSEVSLAYQIQVFPNPTTGKVYLRFNLPEQEDAQIEAYDMLGRLLVQERKRVAPSDVFEIDLSERASGIYLLKIRVDREVLTRKVSVKK